MQQSLHVLHRTPLDSADAAKQERQPGPVILCGLLGCGAIWIQAVTVLFAFVYSVMHVCMAAPSWLQHRLHAAFWNDFCVVMLCEVLLQLLGCRGMPADISASLFSPLGLADCFARRQPPQLKGGCGRPCT